MWDNDSARKARLPSNWNALRQQRLDLDGHKCTWWIPTLRRRCGRPANQVDHKQAMTDDDRLEALQSLCQLHHGRKTALEAYKAKAAKKASRYRPREEHPGGLS